MSYLKLTEGATNLLTDYLRTNISAALDAVGAAVSIPQVSLENPKQYYVFKKPQGYLVPALFVISDDFDLRIQEKQANFINAKHYFKISVVVEDQDEEMLTYKAWRYQSALQSVLDEAEILSVDQKLKLKVVVYHHRFSEVFYDTAAPSGGGKFRKEVLLECQVEHFENAA